MLIILDGGVVRATKVVKHRLEPLGHKVIAMIPKRAIMYYVKERGAVLVTTNKVLADELNGIFIHPKVCLRKNTRTLASLIIKLVFSKN